MSPIDRKQPTKSSRRRRSTANQGEGDRVAARSYERKLQEFVASGRVPAAARDARAAVSGPERARLAEAEARGRAPAKLSARARVVGFARRLLRVVRKRINKITASRGPRRRRASRRYA